MAEAPDTTTTQPATPAAETTTTPPAVTAADVPSFTESAAPPEGQKPEESAPAASPGEEKPVTENKPPESRPRRSQRSFDRKIDKLTRQVHEANARAAQLEQLVRQNQPQERPAGAPDISKFTDAGEYEKAVAKFERERAVAEVQQQAQQKARQEYQARVRDQWEDRLAKADAKYDDWDEVVPELSPDNPVAAAIMTAENGEDVAYHLFKDRKEAQRIAALDVASQIREIGKIEARLLAQPAKPKEPPKLPAPISPLNGAGTPNPMPSDSDDVNTWMRKENERMRARSAAR